MTLQDETRAATNQLLAQERARCRALVEGDLSTLESLLTDDLIHVHASGTVDDKPTYLGNVKAKYIFHRVERGDLKLVPSDGAIIMHGAMTLEVSLTGDPQRHVVHLITTQLWVRRGQTWEQALCHSCFAPS